jgi:type IV secretory pathway VirJ component
VKAAIASLIGLLLVTAPASADELRRATVGNETLQDAPVVAPAGEPEAIVALISGREGWTPARAAEADALAREGAMVIGVDLPRYLEGLSRETDDCVYMPGDIEEYGRLAGKRLGLRSYRFPVLLGVGEGADFAYAMLSQALPNMLSGAVSVGFTGRLPLPKPLCDGPASTRREGRDLVLGNDPKDGLKGEWRIVVPAPAPEQVKAFVRDMPTADLVEAQEGQDLAAAAREAALDIGGGDPDAVNALPLVLYPPTEPAAKGLVVIYSGDGGWRDLDKTIAEYFTGEGYGVVGVDTLRYFWNEKTPRELGADLEAIIGQYGPQWRAKAVLLAGYSFGADAIPFAWGRLSRQVRDQIKLIALLGLSKTADFEVSVAGWLGVREGAHDVLKASAALPMDRVVCVYGADEARDADNDAACATDAFPATARLERPGGHHFDEDYAALARRLADEFQKRAAPQPK